MALYVCSLGFSHFCVYFLKLLLSVDLPYGWEQELDEEGQIIYVE